MTVGGAAALLLVESRTRSSPVVFHMGHTETSTIPLQRRISSIGLASSMTNMYRIARPFSVRACQAALHSVSFASRKLFACRSVRGSDATRDSAEGGCPRLGRGVQKESRRAVFAANKVKPRSRRTRVFLVLFVPLAVIGVSGASRPVDTARPDFLRTPAKPHRVRPEAPQPIRYTRAQRVPGLDSHRLGGCP